MKGETLMSTMWKNNKSRLALRKQKRPTNGLACCCFSLLLLFVVATFVLSGSERLYAIDSFSQTAVKADTIVPQNSGDDGDVQSEDDADNHQQGDDDDNHRHTKGVNNNPSSTTQHDNQSNPTMPTMPNHQGRSRVFLGVWIRLGDGDDRSDFDSGRQYKMEARRQRIHRHTYQEFDYRYKSSNTICSYMKLLEQSASKKLDPNACRLVYVEFRTENFRVRKHQVFLRVDKKQTRNPNVAIPAWITWAHDIQQTHRHIVGDIDYFAVATTKALMLPTKFWNENEMLNATSPTPTIGFLPNPNCTIKTDDVLPSKTATRETTCLDPHFVFLSKDLVGFAAAKTLNETEVVAPKTTSPIDHLYFSLQEQIQTDASSSSETIQMVPMKGVASVPRPIDAVRVWTEYVNSSFSFDMDPVEEARVRNGPTKATTFQGQPRILMGILTTMSEKETRRRENLRITYLRYYANSSTPHRICSLTQLLEKEVRQEDCQFAYTFVVGANPNGTFAYSSPDDIDGYTVKDISNLEGFTARYNWTSGGYVVENRTEVEADVVYLNIQENMVQGKTDTWFRYASLLSDTSLYFDYIGKLDTDTLLHPPEFFSFMSTWPTFPNNVRIYGGRYIVWGAHKRAYGHTYMAGHLYWMSPDLARFMGFSKKVNRTYFYTEMEDMTTGNYVNMLPKLIRHMELNESVAEHGLKLKRTKNFRKAYAKYLLKKTQSGES